MSYAVIRPRRRQTPVPLPTIYPLAQVPPPEPAPAPAMSPAMKKMLVALVVVAIIAAVLYAVDSQARRRRPQPNGRRISKASTAELARRLYDRLDGQGRTSDSTMRSLAQLGSRR